MKTYYGLKGIMELEQDIYSRYAQERMLETALIVVETILMTTLIILVAVTIWDHKKKKNERKES